MANKKSNKSKKQNNGIKLDFSKLKPIINKIINNIKTFFINYWDLIVMNIVIFILTVFVESQYIYNLKLLVWFFNTIIFVALPTVLMYIFRPMKTKEILISIPILYLLFLIFLDYCTIRELYGISSLGLDKIPNYIDAVFVVFAFTMVEYISAFITRKIKKK